MRGGEGGLTSHSPPPDLTPYIFLLSSNFPFIQTNCNLRLLRNLAPVLNMAPNIKILIRVIYTDIMILFKFGWFFHNNLILLWIIIFYIILGTQKVNKTRTKTFIRYDREKDRIPCDDGNTLWWRKHTLMTETHCEDRNTLWWWKHTVMTETHCDYRNTLWLRKYTVMTQKWVTYRDTGVSKN